MQVQIFTNVADSAPAMIVTCTGFSARSLDEFEHEVIAQNAVYQGLTTSLRLITVTGRDRQGTDPLSGRRVVVIDNDGVTTLWQGASDGSTFESVSVGEVVVDTGAGISASSDPLAQDVSADVQPPANQDAP